MSAKHTPGPWFTFANGACIGGPVGPMGNPSGADTAGIAHFGMSLRTGTEIHGNAQLCAAAPDLLQALQVFAERCSSEETITITVRTEHVERARAAIAKATGFAS